ncbi:MAG: DIP1984 family protein [Firmicutes bacterium]|nr:DIP1984 family protein [Bacillota bacterium]
MKLATALLQRADLQKRLAEINNRMKNNAKVQEGEQPSEKPSDLLKELEALLLQLEDLVARINLTNSKTVLEDGRSITALIAHRDMLSKKLSIMRSFLDEASSKVDRYSRAEIKIVSTVDVAKLQKQVDAASKELRETDEKLQELNWTTELI